MKDILIISDYDSGYGFSVMWDGRIYEKGEIYDICYKYVNESTYEMYSICYRHEGKLNFEPIRRDLRKINIYPKVIILCSDGDIYKEERESEDKE